MRFWISVLFILCLVGFVGCGNVPSPNRLSATKTQITYVASSNSKKYHLPDCEWVTKISGDARVTFKNLVEAEQAGYKICKVCAPENVPDVEQVVISETKPETLKDPAPEEETEEETKVFSPELKNSIDALNKALLTISVSNNVGEIETALDAIVKPTNIAINSQNDPYVIGTIRAARHAMADAYVLIASRIKKLDANDPELIDITEPIIRKYGLANVAEYERPSEILVVVKTYIRILDEIYKQGEIQSTPKTVSPPAFTPLPVRLHPPGARAICRDGTYSFSQNRRGTCSHHGGVAQWLY